MPRTRPDPAALACLLAGLFAAPLPAQDLPPGMAPGTNLPEVVLVPHCPRGALGAQAGWILTYRNGLSGPEAPDREVGSRPARSCDGTPFAATPIAWEIARTRNDACTAADGGPCPDRFRILSVPDGFIAAPQDAEVGEGATARIYIVPRGMV